jgi:drug/metabolite transporter (DMT)-like permease
LRERPYAVLLLAVGCVSVGSILVRMAAAPSLAVAFFRVALASLLLSPFALPGLLRSFPALGRAHQAALVGSGLALGLHFATWIASLSFTSIASSVLIVNTAPLATLLFSKVFLGETPPRAVLAAIGLALVGVALIGFGDWGENHVKGDLLAAAGAVTLSAYHVIGRALRSALPLNAYILGVWGTASVLIFVLGLFAGVPFSGYSGRTLAAFLALALVPTLLGHGLANRSLRSLPAPTVSLFMLGEPIGASLLAFLLYREIPSGTTLAGGAIVLSGLGLAILGGSR